MNVTTLNSTADLWGPETWTNPLSLAEFSAQHWCRAPLFINGPATRAKQLLARVEESGGPEVIPANATNTATARTVKDGKLVTLTMMRESAARLLNAGETVSVFEPECLLPLKREFARVMRLPLDRFECSAFFSKSGGVTLPHFDASEGFVLQIRGSKVWTLAKNDVTPEPLDHAGVRVEPHPSIRLHCHDEWPRDMPDGAVTLTADPGSVLYVPRGVWHATNSHEESLSLHFHYKTAAWVDALWPVLYRELLRDPEWRAAASATGDEEQLARLLAKGRDVLGAIVPEDLLRRSRVGEVSNGRGSYRRRAGVAFGVESTESDGSKKLRTVALEQTGDRVTYSALAPELVPAVEWVGGQATSARFTPEEIARATGLSHEDLIELLGVLEEGGLVATV